jgi:hypothetical protein
MPHHPQNPPTSSPHPPLWYASQLRQHLSPQLHWHLDSQLEVGCQAAAVWQNTQEVLAVTHDLLQHRPAAAHTDTACTHMSDKQLQRCLSSTIMAAGYPRSNCYHPRSAAAQTCSSAQQPDALVCEGNTIPCCSVTSHRRMRKPVAHTSQCTSRKGTGLDVAKRHDLRTVSCPPPKAMQPHRHCNYSTSSYS